MKKRNVKKLFWIVWFFVIIPMVMGPLAVQIGTVKTVRTGWKGSYEIYEDITVGYDVLYVPSLVCALLTVLFYVSLMSEKQKEEWNQRMVRWHVFREGR